MRILVQVFGIVQLYNNSLRNIRLVVIIIVTIIIIFLLKFDLLFALFCPEEEPHK